MEVLLPICVSKTSVLICGFNNTSVASVFSASNRSGDAAFGNGESVRER